MSENIKIITCTGYGNSGSSAGTDFLKEFDSISVPCNNFECTFLHETDGIADLAYALEGEAHRLKADLAVKRFLNLISRLNNKYGYRLYFKNTFEPIMTEYIEELVSCTWKGGWHRAYEEENLSLKENARRDFSVMYFEEMHKRNLHNEKKQTLYEPDNWQRQYLPYVTQYYTNTKKIFVPITKKYLYKLLAQLPYGDSEYLALDQLLPPISHRLYSRYFDWIKTIIIDRDPRDLYIASKFFWGSRYIPLDNIDTFIAWFKATRNERLTDTSENVIYIQLEDLIYDYENTKNKIIQCIGISSEKHQTPLKFFNPEKSCVNTRLWTKYNFYNDDIKKIEKELAPFCFDYSKYSLKETDSRKTIDFMFYDIQHEADAMCTKKHISLKLRFLYLKRKLIRSALDSPIVKTMQWFLNGKKTLSLCIRFIIKFGVYTLSFPFYYLYCFFKALINFLIM